MHINANKLIVNAHKNKINVFLTYFINIYIKYKSYFFISCITKKLNKTTKEFDKTTCFKMCIRVDFGGIRFITANNIHATEAWTGFPPPFSSTLLPTDIPGRRRVSMDA